MPLSNVLPSAHPKTALNAQPMIPAMGSSAKGQLVSVVTNRFVLAATAAIAGVAFGVSTIWMIDRYFQAQHGPSFEKTANLESLLNAI